MKPYYHDERAGIVIYHGDARGVLPLVTADVLITDPPYGTQFSTANPGGGYGRRQNYGVGCAGFTIVNDGDSTVRDEVLAMWGHRPACVFGSPRLPDPPGRWVDRLVWDKKRPGMNGGPWRYRHETIFVSEGFVRTTDAAVSVIEAWPGQSQHVHAKPVSVMRLLVAAAPPGVIVDPFLGSGSTLEAAKYEGRRAIGIEICEEWCELSAKRLAQESLLAPPPPREPAEQLALPGDRAGEVA